MTLHQMTWHDITSNNMEWHDDILRSLHVHVFLQGLKDDAMHILLQTCRKTKEKRVEESGVRRRKRAEKRGDDSLDSIGLSDGSPVALTAAVAATTSSKHRKSKSDSRPTSTSTSSTTATAIANDRNSSSRSKIHKNDPRGPGPRSSFPVGSFHGPKGSNAGAGGVSKVPAKVTQNDNDQDIR